MTSKAITIIDYGVGNLLSVRRAFEYCGARVTITSDPKMIERADRLVLPGVGAFPNAMELINRYELAQAVKDFATSGKPLLAICLGMQLLMDESEEFTKTAGLSLIPGRVVELPKTNSKAEFNKSLTSDGAQSSLAILFRTGKELFCQIIPREIMSTLCILLWLVLLIILMNWHIQVTEGYAYPL
jgi:phosphoribosylformylglycinamidine (FGAM) synthase-like amidotransferase family enzyme